MKITPHRLLLQRQQSKAKQRPYILNTPPRPTATWNHSWFCLCLLIVNCLLLALGPLPPHVSCHERLSQVDSWASSPTEGMLRLRKKHTLRGSHTHKHTHTLPCSLISYIYTTVFSYSPTHNPFFLYPHIPPAPQGILDTRVYLTSHWLIYTRAHHPLRDTRKQKGTDFSTISFTLFLFRQIFSVTSLFIFSFYLLFYFSFFNSIRKKKKKNRVAVSENFIIISCCHCLLLYVRKLRGVM